MKKWVQRLGRGLGAVVVATLFIGVAYEQTGRYQTVRRYPPPGRMVDIGSRRLQLDCRGAGSPTVVFESGLVSEGSLSWTAVQTPIAAVTRACSYSRAGIMWSDPRPGPFSGKQAAEDLHALLSRAGEKGPFVLVGHSLGGPYNMIFTKYFGAGVAGLVFVESAHPDQDKRAAVIVPANLPPEPHWQLPLLSALSWTGATRIYAHQTSSPSDLMPHQLASDFDADVDYFPTSLRAFIQETDAMPDTFAEAGTLRDPGARPVYVLAATRKMHPSHLLTAEMGKQLDQAREDMDHEMASWSSRGQLEWVDSPEHYVQFYHPEAVVNAVKSVVESARAEQAAQTHNGH